jgi:hypothetical protein
MLMRKRAGSAALAAKAPAPALPNSSIAIERNIAVLGSRRDADLRTFAAIVRLSTDSLRALLLLPVRSCQVKR